MTQFYISIMNAIMNANTNFCNQKKTGSLPDMFVK